MMTILRDFSSAEAFNGFVHPVPFRRIKYSLTVYTARMSGGRLSSRFSLFIFVLIFSVGICVVIYSTRMTDEVGDNGSDLSLYDEQRPSSRRGLRLEVITNKTEYRLGEEIVAECVVINDSPSAVNITPPTDMGAKGYPKAENDTDIRASVSITWAERELAVPGYSTVTLMDFSFRCEEVGVFVIEIGGFPKTEVTVGIPPAWILGGRTGGGSETRIEANMTELHQFPHLIEAFDEDAEARSRGHVHAGHATYCPAKEALEIIGFLGEEYSTSEREYGFKLTMEDGSFYSFIIWFSWEQPIIS